MEHLVKDSLEHLISLRRTKAIRNNDKEVEGAIKNKKYNDYNWSDLVKSEEVLGKLRVFELEKYLAFHGLSKNGKKGDEVSRMMAHCILTKDQSAQTRVAPNSEAKFETEYHGNNVIIVCKKYYIDTLVKELGINNVNINNPTYIPIDDSFETIKKSHNQFITSVGLEISEEDQNLPYLYWTPKLHKSPYKHRFIAGSSKCTTKGLSCLLTKVLSTIKDGLVRYCNTKTSRNGVNNM